MRTFIQLIPFLVAFFGAFSDEFATEARGQATLAQLTVPDDEMAAANALQEWITKRGFECELRSDTVVLTHQRVLINLYPITSEDELDRLQVATFYFPKDEYRGTEEFRQLAHRLNVEQNMLRVFVDDEGDLAIVGNMTFVDTFEAKEYDYYLDLYSAVIKRYILTEDSLKYLQ